MKNKIRKQLENKLGLENISLEYDAYTNSFAYVEKDVQEKFEDKVIFLLSALQNFGYSFTVSGNLESKSFDICTSNTNMVGIYFI